MQDSPLSFSPGRRRVLGMSVRLLASALITGLTPYAIANTICRSQNQGNKPMKIICLEEHVLDPLLARASMPTALMQAPYLPDWGKTVKDGGNPDRSRPQIEQNALINPKGMDLGEERLKEMDNAGIAMQVLSVGGFPHLGALPDVVSLNRVANDRLAEAVSQHPSRFAAFATLPWAQPDEAEKELERAVKELGLKGALLNGRPSEAFLDHPRYAPLLEKFNELEVPIYLHPGVPMQAVQQSYYSGFSNEVTARLSMFGWGWHHEAGIQLLRLILSGALDRNPKMQLISGHWGEMLPFYLQRLDDSIPQAASGLSRTITQTFQEQVYVTPSGMLTLPHFRFIYELMGAQRILYSIDYPYQTLDGAGEFLERLPIPQVEKEMIAYRNAERLLGLVS